MISPIKNFKIVNGYGDRILHIDGKDVKSFHKGIDLIGDNFDCIALCDMVLIEVILPDSKYPAQYIKNNEGEWIKINLPINRAWTPYIKAINEKDSNIQYVYKHINAENKERGIKVFENNCLGKYGQYGYCFGAHLHFEVLINGINVNPENYLHDVGII